MQFLKQIIQEEVSRFLHEQLGHVESRDLLKTIIKDFPRTAKKLDLVGARSAGEGFYGKAYKTPSGNVVKITSDASEAQVSAKLIGKKLKYVANIQAVYKLPLVKIESDDVYGQTEKMQLYAVVQERLYKLSPRDQNLIDMFDQHETSPKDIEDTIEWLQSDETHAIHPNERLDPKELKRAKELLAAVKDLARFGIKFKDLHSGNVMRSKDGRLKLIDLRGSAKKRPKLKQLKAEEIEAENQIKKEEY
jgi:hypothetical protein